MNDSAAQSNLQSRLERLEALYSEQDYTIQSLNDTVSRQDREISLLTQGVEQLRRQLQTLRAGLADDIDPGFEKPPHY